MVTMGDVAARAGVSQATVSFVLGGRADRQKISLETRERVLDAARELSYQRNQLARAMVTGKSRIIGMITTPDTANNIISILTGAMETASENDYLLKMIHLSWTGIDDVTIARCLEWRLAGAIIVGFSEESHQRLQDAFRENHIPIALVDNVPPGDWGVRIRSDDEQGIRLAVSHLVALGHRKIAFLGGRPGMMSRWRKRSFHAALADAGLSAPAHWVRDTSWSDSAEMERGVRALFEETGQDRPTAIVCAADAVAMVVLRVARSLGLRLPDDLSVTGYTNANLSAFSDPPLTTIEQPFQEMGRVAAQQLIAFAESNAVGGNVVPKDIHLPIRLVERASTAPPPPEPV